MAANFPQKWVNLLSSKKLNELKFSKLRKKWAKRELKAEKILKEIEEFVFSGVSFSVDLKYESACRRFNALYLSLPQIDRWKPEIALMELSDIAQDRFDAIDVGFPEAISSVE